MANRLYRLQDGSLVFTDAALLEYPDGRLRLETTLAENTLYTLPADLLEGIGVLLANREGLGVYRICAEQKQIPARLARTAPHRWTVSLPAGAMAGLKDIRLQIDYTGDIDMLFLGNEMISDNFCNGDTWEVGLREHLSEGAAAMTLVVAPLRHGSRVSVESSMAARSERVEETVGEVISVRAQAVYEILI